MARCPLKEFVPDGRLGGPFPGPGFQEQTFIAGTMLVALSNRRREPAAFEIPLVPPQPAKPDGRSWFFGETKGRSCRPFVDIDRGPLFSRAVPFGRADFAPRGLAERRGKSPAPFRRGRQ